MRVRSSPRLDVRMRCDLMRCHHGCAPAYCNSTRSTNCGLKLHPPQVGRGDDEVPCKSLTAYWQPLRPRVTKLAVRGHLHLLPPLPTEVLSLRWFTPALTRLVASGTLLRAATFLWAPQALWLGAVRAAADTEWQIAVLGSSTTSGCGADENVSAWADCSAALSRACVVAGSWGRAFSDESQRRVAMWQPRKLNRPHVHVYAKNAVPASWFGHCASHKLPASARIVLIEVSANSWNGIASMLARVRQAAPRAAVVFVVWPSKSMLMHQVGASEEVGARGGSEEGVDAIFSAARAQGADVLKSLGPIITPTKLAKDPFSTAPVMLILIPMSSVSTVASPLTLKEAGSILKEPSVSI